MNYVTRNPLATIILNEALISKYAYIRSMLKKVVNEGCQIIPATTFSYTSANTIIYFRIHAQ